jgi:2-methylisocitrate lyase-like PEP mutase family enzyme
MHARDGWREDLIDALTSEAGANGAMRRACAYNEAIADQVALDALDEHEDRTRRRVKAHQLRAGNLRALTWPIVVELWHTLPWSERARIALALVWPRWLRT